jgi:type II secretory pathway pseudopilin PulG
MATVPKIVAAAPSAAAAPRTSRGEAGFTLIDLLFTASLICTLSTMALPALLRARNVAQSASAVATLRVVNSAQLSFAVTCGSGFYAPAFTTLGTSPPSGAPFLPPELATGVSFVKQGYNYSMTGAPLLGAPASCNGLPAGEASPGYAAFSDPLDGVANPLYYATNADGTIYQHNTTLNGIMPESGPPPAGIPVK